MVVGATGATGRQVIKELLANDQWTEVLTVVRRPGAGVYYDGELPAKLKEVVVRNFAEDLRSTLQAWKVCPCCCCCDAHHSYCMVLESPDVGRGRPLAKEHWRWQ